MTRPVFDDGGQVGGIEGVVFGVLVFVMGTLLIANAWAVIDAKVAAGAAAREATRTFVESRAATPEEAAADAEEAAVAALVGHGRDPSRMEIDREAGSLARCARVTFRVEYHVPLITIPILGRYGKGFTATARHAEIVDPYRSGLTDAGECPSELRS